MKLLLLIFVTLFTVSSYSEDCGTTSCFDYCSSSYKTVHGDTCDTSFNFELGCYEAYGYCANNSGSNSCEGETVSCFDYCSSSYITVQGDTCESSFDYEQGCYAAYGSCSK